MEKWIYTDQEKGKTEIIEIDQFNVFTVYYFNEKGYRCSMPVSELYQNGEMI